MENNQTCSLQESNPSSSINFNHKKSFQLPNQQLYQNGTAASLSKIGEKQLCSLNEQSNISQVIVKNQEIILQQTLEDGKNSNILFRCRLYIFLIFLISFLICWIYLTYKRQVAYQQKLKKKIKPVIQIEKPLTQNIDQMFSNQTLLGQQLSNFKDLRNFLSIQKKFQIFSDQKIIFQNGIQQTVVFEVQLKNISNFNQKNQIVPMYMWLGDKLIPQKYQKSLNSLEQYKFIRNCDGLIKMMETKLNTKFKIIQKVNLRSDLCKGIYLYFYGGLYADLDTIIDLNCLNQFLKNKKNHIQASRTGKQDLYLLYFRDPYNKELLKGIQKWDYYHTEKKWKDQFTPFIRFMKQKEVSHSGCVLHFQDRTWKDIQKPNFDKPIKK